MEIIIQLTSNISISLTNWTTSNMLLNATAVTSQNHYVKSTFTNYITEQILTKWNHYLLQQQLKSIGQSHLYLNQLNKYSTVLWTIKAGTVYTNKIHLNDTLPLLTSQTTHNLTTIEWKLYKNLNNCKTALTIKPADKNLGTVIMDTDDYI